MTSQTKNRDSGFMNWILRFFKGVIIAMGFILPGVSGGVLAAILGIYERILGFMANITKNIKENLLFFLPVALGGIVGIVLLSAPLEYLLDRYHTIVMWCFAGCIVGTLPALNRQSKAQGRGKADWAVFAVTFVLGFILLYYLAWLENHTAGGILPADSMLSWVIAGVLIALGIIVPGLSPSNLLIVLGLFDAMIAGFKGVKIMVFLPIAVGAIATLLLFSKFMERMLHNHYSKLYHFILGIVSASTLLIVIPPVVSYADFSFLDGILSAVLFALGYLLGWWMGRLEEKYKK